jgi:hypothetical protein
MKKLAVLCVLLCASLVHAQTYTKGVAYNGQASNPCTAAGLTVPCNWSNTSSTLLHLSTASDGASAVAHVFDTSTPWSNAAARLISLRTNGTEKAYTLANGINRGGDGALATPAFSFVDHTGHGMWYNAGFLSFSVSGTQTLAMDGGTFYHLGVLQTLSGVAVRANIGLDPGSDATIPLGSASARWGPIRQGTASIGTALSTGLYLTNTTAAAAGAQQYSPAVTQCGMGWKTNATAASQSVCFSQQARPSQNASEPDGELTWSQSINGGAETDLFSIITSAVNTSNLYLRSRKPVLVIYDSGQAESIQLQPNQISLGVNAFTLQVHTDNGVYPSTDGTTSLGRSANRWMQAWSKRYATTRQAVTYSATPTFDPTNGDFQTITLTGNITSWTFSAGIVGEVVTIEFIQDGTGGRTIAGTPANVVLAGGSLTLSTAASARDTVTFRYDDNASKWVEIGRSIEAGYTLADVSSVSTSAAKATYTASYAMRVKESGAERPETPVFQVENSSGTSILSISNTEITADAKSSGQLMQVKGHASNASSMLHAEDSNSNMRWGIDNAGLPTLGASSFWGEDWRWLYNDVAITAAGTNYLALSNKTWVASITTGTNTSIGPQTTTIGSYPSWPAAKIQSGTSSSNVVRLQGGGVFVDNSALTNLVLVSEVDVALDTTGSDCNFWIGVGNNDISGANPNAMFFRKLNSDTNWQYFTNNGAANTNGDTGVAPAANTWATFRMEYYGSAAPGAQARVKFFINGSLVGTSTATLPSARLSWQFVASPTATNNRIMYVGRIRTWWNNFASPLNP